MTTTPKKRRRGLPVKPEALRLMEEKMREKGFTFTTQEGMYEELSEKAGLSSDTIKNVFNPHHERNPEKNTVRLIAKALDIDPSDIVEGWNPPESSSRVKSTGSKVYIFNRETFQEMLDKQRELTANPLINANFEASKLYIPLGLVESKKEERRKDVSPEMGSRLYRPEEYEITRQFENDEFLTEVLLQGNSPKSQGKRIAIIGEPGSGKTTRLQQIADRIFNENDDNLVIWVSLADLQDRTLEDFLLNTWLKIALKQREASEVSQNELIEKFNEDNVWLLLDGLDEMVLDSNLLIWVDSQINKINGWIKSAKIILTCRVNVWESGNNYLSYFDVYRNLDFSEPQRDEFIYKFFTDRNLADQLITELNRDEKERIRDLVKNPLRLTLVCYSWKNHQGSLPETKAGLYQECVEAFYLWKEVQLKKTIAQRKQLNQALGELAKQALEQNSSRFRLTKSFICKVLGESDEGLFKLALDLGWLNRVGVAEENPSEQVYAFFHPSFQEYFAALAIDESKFWLHHTPNNPHNGSYRIFEEQWKEVFFLWLGCPKLYEQKTDLYDKILNFDCQCDWIYTKKILTLASLGLNEFNYQNKERLISKTIDITLSITRHPDYTLDHVDWSIDELYIIENISQINDKIVKKILLAKLESETQKNWTYLIILCALLRVDINDKKILNLFVDFLSERLEYEIIDAHLGYSFLSENFRRVFMVKCRYYDYVDKYLDYSFRDLAMDFIQTFLSNFKPKKLSEDNSFYIFKKLFDKCLELEIKYLSFGLIQYLELDIRYLSFGLLISSSDLIFNTLFSVISLPNLGQQHEKNVFLFFSYLDIYQERFAPNDCTVFCSLLYIKEMILNDLEVSLSVINYLDALLSQEKYSIFIKEHQDYLDSIPF
jgi:lambda repressor-like predicted transcriptional regulator/energy-coupling factor transporter ATP-binding protein EcfA2